ncbi:hypothetical protein [Streptomyces violaceusniger]|uniref:hypothetical protein n=1 Tax=Streptomyces violaceusniger TaxID=68280 RepID=UPI002073E26D|nr:hypothetical protein [Streptomyces violaceusniger]
MVDELGLTVEIAGVPLGPADRGVAAGDRPAPFQEQDVDAGGAVVEGVYVAEVVAGFEAVAVGLEEDDVVPAGAEGVDEGAAVAAAPSGVSVTPLPRKPQKLYPIFTW